MPNLKALELKVINNMSLDCYVYAWSKTGKEPKLAVYASSNAERSGNGGGVSLGKIEIIRSSGLVASRVPFSFTVNKEGSKWILVLEDSEGKNMRSYKLYKNKEDEGGFWGSRTFGIGY